MAVLINNVSYRLKMYGEDEQILIRNKEYIPYEKWIVPNKVKYGDEAFVFTVNVPNGDLDFYIPLNGYITSGITQNVPYNWAIEWGDNTTETKSGNSSNANTNWIQHTYTTQGTYTIIIKPVVDDYAWMRAWSFLTTVLGNSNMVSNKEKIISFDYVTNKSFMESNTSYGQNYLRQLATGTKITSPINEVKIINENNITNIDHYFKYAQYYNCTNLISPEIEVLPDSITNINSNFRYQQYYGCSNLTSTATEVLPNSVKTIGSNFRQNQYHSCSKLTTTTVEVLPNGVTNIGDSFRNNQYYSCINISTPAIEVLPSSVTSIGASFRYQQYWGCSNLTSVAIEVMSNGITYIGGSFRQNQYWGCINLTSITAEILPNNVTSIGANFRQNQYNLCSKLTVPATEAMPNSVTTVGNNFRYAQYNNCTNILIGNHVHIRMDEFINIGPNSTNTSYYNIFNVSTAKIDSDTIPNYKDINGNIYPITNLTPAVRKQYCLNRTGIDGYTNLATNWK